MENLLIVGFIFGLRHAIEGDHFAAVASLTTQAQGHKSALKIGLVWGMGHTLMLFLVGGTVLLLDSVVPTSVASLLEWIVGFMLVLLGIDVVRRAIKSKVHFHAHTHQDGVRHFHAHSHKNDRGEHNANLHYHTHQKRFPLRAFMVGMVHGLAGSAALVLLTLNSSESKWVGLGYILIFGLGSIIGMGMLSFAIALPLNKIKNISHIYHTVCIVAGLFTVVVGALLLNEHSPLVYALL